MAENPRIESSDFYLFRSYQAGRSGYVTLLANYQPRQRPAAGPLFSSMDPDALYELHVDNTGDAVEDLTFQFRFSNDFAMAGAGLKMAVGSAGAQVQVPVPFAVLGPVTASNSTSQNEQESFTLTLVRGARRTGTASAITSAIGATRFRKPLDNLGSTTFPDYATYAASHITDLVIPGCTPPTGTLPRVFVGQRKESSFTNRGQLHDLFAFDLDPATPQANPLGPADQGANTDGQSNVITIALEVPIDCVAGVNDTIIGGWTSASLRQVRVINPSVLPQVATREGGPWVQVSHTGMPLLADLVIGAVDRDLFNASSPVDAVGRFPQSFTHPVFPEYLEVLLSGVGITAPDSFPRNDFLAFQVQGITGLNATQAIGDMVRLNLAMSATPAASQQSLGALPCFDRTLTGVTLDPSNTNCDTSGFPNGRRPGDDVIDIFLRVSMGATAGTMSASSGGLPLVDGAYAAPTSFGSTFPYLLTPLPGAP